MTYLTLLTANQTMDAVVKTAGIEAIITTLVMIVAVAVVCFLGYYFLWARLEEYTLGEAVREYFRILFLQIPKITFGVMAAIVVIESVTFGVTCWNAFWDTVESNISTMFYF